MCVGTFQFSLRRAQHERLVAMTNQRHICMYMKYVCSAHHGTEIITILRVVFEFSSHYSSPKLMGSYN